MSTRQSISEWVMNHFNKPGAISPQNFNVASYTAEEKQNGITDLQGAGYTVELENHDNSLKVSK